MAADLHPTRRVEIAGASGVRAELEHLLAGWAPVIPLLLNTDSADAQSIIARSRHFASDNAPGLIVTLLTAPPEGLDHLDRHAANATLWAFTQQAALEWAPRGMRVNAIGLGASPTIPFAPGETAGPAPARPATPADIARIVRAIAGWPSMTGQLLRLGT